MRRLTCKKILPTFSSSLLPEVTITQKRKLVSGWLGALSEDPNLAGCCNRSHSGVSMRKAKCAFQEVSILRDKDRNCCPVDSNTERQLLAPTAFEDRGHLFPIEATRQPLYPTLYHPEGVRLALTSYLQISTPYL